AAARSEAGARLPAARFDYHPAVAAPYCGTASSRVTFAESNGGTAVFEGGATDSYTVQLASAPNSTVEVVAVSNSQVSTSPLRLYFTTANWATAQTVTVTGVDDVVKEGLHTGVITHGTTSTDSAFNGLCVSDLTASITDNDSTAPILLVQSAGATVVTESDEDDEFTLVLGQVPGGPVTVTIGHVGGQFTLSTTTMFFTSLDYYMVRSVRVTAINDTVWEGAHSGLITFTVESDSFAYNGRVIPSLTVAIVDNESGVRLEETGSTTVATEGAHNSPDRYTVRLETQPTHSVTVSVNGGTQLHLRTVVAAPLEPVNVTSLTFTSTNWSVPQIVYVTGVDDAVVEGAHTQQISHLVDSSDKFYDSDGYFGGVALTGWSSATVVLKQDWTPTLTADIDDNDVRVIVAETDGSTIVKEGVIGDTYSIRLAVAPAAFVSVAVGTTSNQITLSPASVGFDSSNWYIPKVISIVAIDDSIVESQHTAVITHRVQSTDPVFDGTGVNNIRLNVLDNDAINSPPSDFDGDGVSDRTVYRAVSGEWVVRRTSTGLGEVNVWGMAGGEEIPVPLDYDGDGKTDRAVFRPSTAQWFIYLSGSQQASVTTWGIAEGGDLPAPGDFDGDGQADIAVYRRTTGQWFILLTRNKEVRVQLWGDSRPAYRIYEVPLPADYDGDTITDFGIYQSSTGNWFVKYSGGGFDIINWGEGGGVDIPVPADYDGDRRADLAVYQPTRALWAVRSLVTGAVSSVTWGIAGTDDLPVAGDFDGDGTADRTIYRRSTAQWITKYSSGRPPEAITWGEAGSRDYPIPAPDFDLNYLPYY
ncbi:MAG: FG-GAP-like repeat-containing protein, partial [Chloroflexi bacterium]|nr:FG-GAP-like repeat-containing protein [Chloroflexota bacterium]